MKQATPLIWSTPAHPKGQAVSSFKVTKKLAPGTAGAQKLLHRFGDALVCVRYRVTPDGEARCTTAEPVQEQVPIRPRAGWLVGSKSPAATRHCNHTSRGPAASWTQRSA